MELNQKGKIDWEIKIPSERPRYEKAAMHYSLYQFSDGDMSQYLHLGYHIGDGTTLPAWLAKNHKRISNIEAQAQIALQTKPRKTKGKSGRRGRRNAR